MERQLPGRKKQTFPTPNNPLCEKTTLAVSAYCFMTLIKCNKIITLVIGANISVKEIIQGIFSMISFLFRKTFLIVLVITKVHQTSSC